MVRGDDAANRCDESIEDSVAADLSRLCALKLAEMPKRRAKRGDANGGEALRQAAPFAMLVSEVESTASGSGMAGGCRVIRMEDALPKPMRSILEVVEAQSRRIDDINRSSKPRESLSPNARSWNAPRES